MVQHVYERAKLSRYIDDVIVATDDPRIEAAVRQFGGRVRMTSSEHLSGTDRLAEVACSDVAGLYVNVQGDEPLIDPEAIDAGVIAMLQDDSVAMGTLKKVIQDDSEVRNPNVVKVVTDPAGHAIYFSRSPIPFQRDFDGARTVYFKHIGVYVYRREFLLEYPNLPVGPLEVCERLEQLRAIENGHAIRVVETDYESLGVDSPEDLDRVNRLFALAADSVGTT